MNCGCCAQWLGAYTGYWDGAGWAHTRGERHVQIGSIGRGREREIETECRQEGRKKVMVR